jgi:cell division GTPase FtsZ
MITMKETKSKRRPRPLRIALDDARPNAANIKVVGVGGGGGNAVNRMIATEIDGIEFVAANTDCQALKHNRAPVKIQLGAKLTKGLGAGANPEIGRSAALEDTEKMVEALSDTDMVFITTGRRSSPTWPARRARWSSPSSRCPSRSRAGAVVSSPTMG